MHRRSHRRKSPGSLAKRNIRWAAIALIALSLAPSVPPGHDLGTDETRNGQLAGSIDGDTSETAGADDAMLIVSETDSLSGGDIPFGLD
jgi:hypothetical protein